MPSSKTYTPLKAPSPAVKAPHHLARKWKNQLCGDTIATRDSKFSSSALCELASVLLSRTDEASAPKVVNWVPVPEEFLAIRLDDLVKDVCQHCLYAETKTCLYSDSHKQTPTRW